MRNHKRTLWISASDLLAAARANGHVAVKPVLPAGADEKELNMRDEIDMRLWNEHHESLSTLIGEFVDAVRVSLAKLHEIEFKAPWRDQGRTAL